MPDMPETVGKLGNALKQTHNVKDKSKFKRNKKRIRPGADHSQTPVHGRGGGRGRR